MILLRLVETVALLSVISLGGANATLPEIHRRIVVENHWMTDATFAQIVAIGQAAPGPNVMVISMVGWQLSGLLGLLAATLAMVVPSSSMALVLGRGLARFEDGGRVALARRALAPVALGFMLASAVVMTRAAWQGAATLVVVGIVVVMAVATKLSPLWAIAGGALFGILGHRLHWL